MNKSVLRTMIVIIISMLAFEYILKFFVPKEFVLVISNPNLIKFGKFLSEHLILEHFVRSIFSYVTFYLFTCACSRNKYLSWKLSIFIGVIVVVSVFITLFAYQYATPFLVCIMIFLAMITNSNMKDFAIVFIVHTVAQNLSMNIRNISSYMMSFDQISCFIMTFECYIWLLLFYFLNCYNIKEKEAN